MTSPSQLPPDQHTSALPDQTLFGIPLGRLGWFSCLLTGFASGFAAFFAGTFFAILVFLVLNSTGHHLDYSLTYKRVGLPFGLAVGVLALGYLGVMWARRKIYSR